MRYLSPHYRLVVIGFGDPPDGIATDGRIEWHILGLASPEEPVRTERRSLLVRLVPPLIRPMLRRLVTLVRRIAGVGSRAVIARLFPPLNEWIFWREPVRREALEVIRSVRCDAIHANDLDGLPIAIAAARETGVPVVYDAHEYSPGEYADRLRWRIVEAPARRYLLDRYAPQAAARITVADGIAERFDADYGPRTIVVLNAPEVGSLAPRSEITPPIRMIHHGVAAPGREPERMIAATALCGGRYTLDLMLLGNDEYARELQRLARERAPDVVRFRKAVLPNEIVDTLSEYDIGIFVLPENNFNHAIAMPNKLFDFIAAGLAVCIGPSDGMARIIRRYECGVIAPSFEPADVARALLELDASDIAAMQEASRRAAASDLNAEAQMAKLVSIYRSLLRPEHIR